MISTADLCPDCHGKFVNLTEEQRSVKRQLAEPRVDPHRTVVLRNRLLRIQYSLAEVMTRMQKAVDHNIN